MLRLNFLPMAATTRRSFLAGSAAFAVAPALATAAVQPDFDVVIVGAGAAGIAAARRVSAAGCKYVVLEASDRWGGRCFTDVRTFRIPYERGARYIYTPDDNPVAKLGRKAGLDFYPAPLGPRLRIGRRKAREGEMEDFIANLLRCNRGISDAARGKADVSCAQALPKDLGDWRATIEFVLGHSACGKALSDISASDFARSVGRDVAAFCRQGLSTLLGKLALGSPIRFYSPVTRIGWGGRLVEAETGGTVLTARTAIVTASTGVLSSGKIKFQPALPPRHHEAIGKLGLGSYEHVAIEFAGNPLGLQSDDVVFEKAADFAHGGADCECLGLVTLCGGRRWQVGGPTQSGRRSTDDELRYRLAHGPVRHRSEAGGRAHARHALDKGALGSRGVISGVSGRPMGPRGPLGAIGRVPLVRGRGRARYAMGHRRGCVGGWRTCRRRCDQAPRQTWFIWSVIWTRHIIERCNSRHVLCAASPQVRRWPRSEH